ncbi:MAG: EAL domain-containing protein [Butyrivibrio sp.]|jgi:diguanylate cyclase (GGDEF)-like protein|nr:EAL domain-containing protein [Butyrivibrio sp.]
MSESFYDIDQLTGLMNRESFKKSITKAMGDFPEDTFSLISVDIDNFKVYNYYFGVEKGDDLLRFLGDKVGAMIENLTHAYACRVSGDKFLVFCVYDDELLNQKIKDFLESFKEYVSSYTIKPSFGMYVITDVGTPVELMINYAVMAGKSIKGDLKKYIAYYTPAMGDEVEREQEIMGKLQPALENDQFLIYYQPKYDLKTERPFCSEALVRWRDSKGNIHMPDEFVPIYEKNMVIGNLDFHVFECVCRHLRELLDSDIKPFPVSVNISLINLFNPNFIEILMEKLNRYDISMDLVQLEFTESAMFENQNLIRATIERLHDKGFYILLDDFGKGTASLTMLNDMSIDILKIDKSLLEKNPFNSKSGKILTSIINMAKWLELPVIVEGVESKEQVRFLKNINCEYAQGYYYSKPIPEKEYDELLIREMKRTIKHDEEVDQYLENKNKRQIIKEIFKGISLEDAAYLALKAAGIQTWIYDPKYKAIYNDNKIGAFWDYGMLLENVPYSMTETGLVHPDDKEKFIKMFKSIDEGEPYVECFARLKNKEGNQNYYLSHICYTNVFDEHGNPIKAIGVLLGTSEITVGDDSERPMVPGMYFIMSMNLRTKAVLDKRTVFPDLRENISNVDLSTLRREVTDYFQFPDDIHDSMRRYVDELLTKGRLSDNAVVKRFNFFRTWPDTNKKQWLVWELYVKKDEETGDMIGYNVIKDNDMAYREQQRLEKAAESDSMTGLLNHNAAVKNIREFLNGEGAVGRHALFMLDIDDFKSVNDTFGHQTGDEVIINISRRLKRLFKQTDIIGRYGGDEFIVLAKNYKEPDKLINKAKSMLEKLEYTLEKGDQKYTVYCSIGIAVVQNGNINDIELRQRADAELYKVKEKGKHGFSIIE